MPTPEIVTAAVLVIGDEILSGRTKDKNIGYIAEYLTALGIDLREVRVVPDVEAEIVGAVDALRAPLHLRVHHRRHRPDARRHHRRLRRQGLRRAAAISTREAVAILKERLAKMGGELNEARMRMTRIPQGGSAGRQQGLRRARLLDRQCHRHGRHSRR